MDVTLLFPTWTSEWRNLPHVVYVLPHRIAEVRFGLFKDMFIEGNDVPKVHVHTVHVLNDLCTLNRGPEGAGTPTQGLQLGNKFLQFQDWFQQ